MGKTLQRGLRQSLVCVVLLVVSLQGTGWATPCLHASPTSGADSAAASAPYTTVQHAHTDQRHHSVGSRVQHASAGWTGHWHTDGDRAGDSCCIGCGLPAALLLIATPPAMTSGAIGYQAAFLPSIYPDSAERPPQYT